MCGLQQTDPVESLRTVGESLGGVCRIEERQLAVEHRTHPGAECRGFFCSIGEFGNHLVHDAAREEIGRPDSLPGGHVRSVRDVVMQDRARTFGRQGRQPAVLGREHPIGRDQRERAAAGALPEQQGDGGDVERDHVGDAARDLTGQTAFLRLLRQCRARGVDDRHQRQVQFRRQPHSPAGLP